MKRCDPDVEALHAALNAKRARRTDAAIRELAYNCAGIGAAAIMDQAPGVAMPTEAIVAAVDALLATKVGIDPPESCTAEGPDAQAMECAHDPALGADRSVNLGAVTTWLWTSAPGMAAWQREQIADAVAREFGGGRDSGKGPGIDACVCKKVERP